MMMHRQYILFIMPLFRAARSLDMKCGIPAQG